MTTEHKLIHFLTAACLLTTAAAQSTPKAALRLLKVGNKQFATGHGSHRALDPGTQRTLAHGQQPLAIVLCCTDSRVPPEHVFNTDVGDLFVVRLAGNVLSSEALASVEYAAEHLGCQLCVVLGHEDCEVLAESTTRAQEARDGQPVATGSPALEQLLRAIEPAAQQALEQTKGTEARHHHTEREHARNMALECLRRSQLLRRLHELGKFDVRPARYRLATGKVDWLPTKTLPAGSPPRMERTRPSSPAMPPHAAMRLLQAGHRRFLNRSKPIGDISHGKRKSLTRAQRPLAIVVSCADSRVIPERIFDADLGDLCVVRMAGNVMTDEVLASIELAATQSGAPLLIVMGHSLCETIELSLEHPGKDWRTPHQRALHDEFESVVETARRTATRSDDLLDVAIRANVMRSLTQARIQSPALQQLEAQGAFAMMPVLYDLQTGDLEWLADEPLPPAHAVPMGETESMAKANKQPAVSTAPIAADAAPEPANRSSTTRPPDDTRHSKAPDRSRDGSNKLAMTIGAVGIASLLGGLWMALRNQD